MKYILYIYSDLGNLPLVAPRCGYNVTCVHVQNLDINCINYFDIIWFDIPYNNIDEIEEIILLTLNIIEHSNPMNFVITSFKNNLLDNAWYMYGLPYRDINPLNYGCEYDSEMRIYTNIFAWNNDLINRYNRLLRNKRRRLNNRYRISAVLIREILQCIL